MSSYEDDGSMPAHRCKPPRQFDARYAFELDIEQETTELRLFDVGEKCFRRGIGNGLDSRSAQQPAKRSAYALVVINNRNVSGCNTAHRDSMSKFRRERCCRLLPFREGLQGLRNASLGYVPWRHILAVGVTLEITS